MGARVATGARLGRRAALLASLATCLAVPAGAGAATQTFDHTGAAQSFTVPAGVTELSVDAYGGEGGSTVSGTFPGGLGGRAMATIPVTPGEALEVNVGGTGGDGAGIFNPNPAGGFNGGGDVSGCPLGDHAGAGGGASDVRRDADGADGYELDERLVVAGGGGGADNIADAPGGAGGGTSGGPGGVNGPGTNTAAGGGTQTEGGAAGTTTLAGGGNGLPGELGAGADNTVCGGAGGGGLYGGGSGAARIPPGCPCMGGGGGGGSGFTPGGAGMTNGVRSGHGQVVISFSGQATPGLTTDASPDVTLGGQVDDSATLAGGFQPTGLITFSLYGPDDESCSGAPVFTDTKAVSGNGSYTSASFTPTSPGTYRWIASYSGDADNQAAAGACNDPGETVTVSALPSPDSPPPDSPPPDSPPPEQPPPDRGPTVAEFLTADCRSAGAGVGAAQPLLGAAAGGELAGTEGQDMILGTVGPDEISGLAGADCLRGRAGKDVVDGGADADVIHGGRGGDRIDASSPERDLLACGKGRDKATVSPNDRTRRCEKVKTV